VLDILISKQVIEMKIFFSHCSRDKPLLREIQRNLPSSVKAWIDETELRVGKSLKSSIRNAITQESNFVVIFIGPESIKSEWVMRELNWALEHEKIINRPFVLPVLLEQDSWYDLPKEFQDRIYLRCPDFTESGVRELSKKLYDQLFLLLSDIKTVECNTYDNLATEDKYALQNKCRNICQNISDDQDNAMDKAVLTCERLETLICCMDTNSKIDLLCLYEIQFGKFNYLLEKGGANTADMLHIKIRSRNESTWSKSLEWWSNPFKNLKHIYGLGNEKYEVRLVFLEAIHKLNINLRMDMFSGLEIIDCSFYE
jgi:hypothetical protein